MSTPSRDRLRVLVLGGGPDPEREVSLQSSAGVAQALRERGHEVALEVIDRLDERGLAALAGDVIFPVLHGPWGEGGPLQDLLEASGRPYVGCGPRAARLAMDKLATKLAAAACGVPTLPACALNLNDVEPPLGLPCVVKPVHEGSSVGVHICDTRERWDKALETIRAERAGGLVRAVMVERAAMGARELTVGVLDGVALPVIEIKPAVAFYTYEAKYQRNDTRYVVDPDLPSGLSRRVQEWAATLARAMGVRHLCRVDFLLEAPGAIGGNAPGAWMLEANTMPGFTSHSLLPMAAAKTGLDFGALAERLVMLALRDAPAERARGGGASRGGGSHGARAFTPGAGAGR